MKNKQRIYFIITLMLLLLILIHPTAEVEGSSGEGYSRLLSPESNLNQTDPEQLKPETTSDSSSNQYIVVMKDTVRVAQSEQGIQQAVVASGGRVKTFYTAAINGFAAELPPDALEQLQADPNVALIEPDYTMTIDTDWAAANQVEPLSSQPSPVWGLDRIDQRDLPLDQSFTYNTTAGNVHVYVVDTGLRATHNEFTGRIGNGVTTIYDGYGTADCHGHGTHVAGTIGGTTYGVAKGVIIHPVRVLDCWASAQYSGIIAGLEWIIQNGVAPGVVNMSLAGSASDSLDLAVNNVIKAGFTVVIAAGNESKDACQMSPARTPDAITVGATYVSDYRPTWSNYGPCLDLFAPGVSVKSSAKDSDTATAYMSGTSMAAPHVAGVAALYLQDNPAATPEMVTQFIIDEATSWKVVDPGTNSPNRLLFVNSGSPIPLQPIYSFSTYLPLINNY